MSQMKSALVAKLYRASLKAAKRLDSNARSDVATVLGQRSSKNVTSTKRPSTLSVTIPTASHMVRHVYRAPSTSEKSEEERLDAAVALLAELNKAATLLESPEDVSPRSAAGGGGSGVGGGVGGGGSTPFSQYRVGDVVEVPVLDQRQAGQGGPAALRKGLIVGCDPICQAGEAYKRATPAPSSRAQPHYHVLLDASAAMMQRALQAAEEAAKQAEAQQAAAARGLKWDAPKGTGAAVQESPASGAPLTLPSLRDASDVCYVAQESLRPLAAAAYPRPEDRLLLHPLLPHFFRSFDPLTGRYEMSAGLEALYPLDSYAAHPLPARVAARLGKGNKAGMRVIDTVRVAALVPGWTGGIQGHAPQAAAGQAPGSPRANSWSPMA